MPGKPLTPILIKPAIHSLQVHLRKSFPTFSIQVTTTISICATLATSLGPHCKHHVKTIGPALIGCLGDSKPALRAAAVGALDAWVDNTTLTPLVECEAFSDALKLENPNLRQEVQ